MRYLSAPRYVLVACIAAVLSNAASAQLNTSDSSHCDAPEAPNGPCPAPVLGTVGIVSMGGGMALQEETQVVVGHPYTAEALTEIKQTLSNGSHITRKIKASVGRDSKGRTFRKQTMDAVGLWVSAIPAGVTDSAPTLTTIFDPVRKVHIDYTDSPKQAHILSLPDSPGSVAFRQTTSGGGTSDHFFAMQGQTAETATNKVMFSAPQTPATMPEPATESLGEKTIEGFKVTGKRTTVTIPAGKIGNDAPIAITHETWYSPELQLVLESLQDDPRFGTTTYTLLKVSTTEPDAKLFQVPDGYAIDNLVDNLPSVRADR